MRKLFFLFLALVATTPLWAHNFEVDGIYYNYLVGNKVEVTCRGYYYDDYDDEYSGEVIIPSTVTHNGTTYSVTSIGDKAFSSCKSLTSITIPNSVTSIEYYAFFGCSSLTSITIPNSVTSIEYYAFAFCSSLTSITIPNSVTTVGGGMFYGCRKLKSVVLSNNITSLPIYNAIGADYGFFENCSSLTSITIPNSVTSIGNEAFRYCSSLTSITIPNSVTSIGYDAFYYCSALTSIVIPDGVTSIGKWAFSGCSSLTSVTIGNSVTSIGYSAFSSCSSLTSITCLGVTPPEASDLAANTSTCKLIVPHSAYNAYLRHAYWGQFLNIVPSSETESSAPEIYVNPANPAQKLLRNGQVYILKDDKTYTIMGAQIQ